MREILKKYGKIKDEYDKKFTVFFLLDYGANHKNIKIELSKKKSPYDTYETINFYGTDITAMTKDCITANKFLALYRRWTNRDLFDIRFFLKNHFPIKKSIIEKESKLTYHKFLLNIKKEITTKFNSKTLLAEIGDLITEKQKNFVKNSLVQETLGYLDLHLKFKD